jgi:hypothetical protein
LPQRYGTSLLFSFWFLSSYSVLPLRKYYCFVGGLFFTSEETSPSSLVPCGFLLLVVEDEKRPGYRRSTKSSDGGTHSLFSGYFQPIICHGTNGKLQQADEVRNRAMEELTHFSQAISSLFFAMEQTENSNKSVGYESDNVPLISLVTPNVSNKKRKKTFI